MANRRAIHDALAKALENNPRDADASGLAVMGLALLVTGQPTNNIFADVKDFHDLIGVKPPTPLSKEAMAFRLTLINEEHKELIKAIADEDEHAELDALIDLIYVLVGTIVAHEWDGVEAWRRVHAANMKKIPASKPTIRAAKTGQVDAIKPPGWVAPDLYDCLS